MKLRHLSLKNISLFFIKCANLNTVERYVSPMSKNNYSKSLYTMYEEMFYTAEKYKKEINYLNLEINKLKSDLTNTENKAKKDVEKAEKLLNIEVEKQTEALEKAQQEIIRLKSLLEEKDNIINNLTSKLGETKEGLNIKDKPDTDNDGTIDKDYLIDKLSNQVNKNSTNSNIPTSKEIKPRTNTYNHREASVRSTGGQKGHKGSTLTKQKIIDKINTNKLEVREIVHYVNNKDYKKKIEKYKIGVEVKTYVEKHIFIPSENSKNILPKEFYSDVTYCNDLKSLVLLLGNYCALSYKKINEIIYDLTDKVVNISEGTIDNIYLEFSNKSDETLSNITNNLLNSKHQYSDETVTKENGKETYYRAYGNKNNILYKYHHNKGDKPIEEDNILTRFFGVLITDHEVGMFKYGTKNQDCIVHFGRYCIEQKQNITITTWQMMLYNLLLKFDRNRHILKQFGATGFNEEEIKFMEKEYNELVQLGQIENEFIKSTYWKEKAKTLLNRCIKYRDQLIYFIRDFEIDSNTNFIERALRMIKTKTKISGGFRSTIGGVRFGNIMSIIKTSKLRNISPYISIVKILNNESLFA